MVPVISDIQKLASIWTEARSSEDNAYWTAHAFYPINADRIDVSLVVSLPHEEWPSSGQIIIELPRHYLPQLASSDFGLATFLWDAMDKGRVEIIEEWDSDVD